MTDADRLLVEAAQRDRSKFAELYERHFERVYAYVASRVGDRDAAEDVTAEVFHKALASLNRFEFRGAPFGAWLIAIAGNLIVDRFRRSTREAAAVDQHRAPDAAVEPDRFEDRARLFRLVDELPPDQRRVILERFVEERSVREIAHRLTKSEGAVKQLQFRALQALRARMEDDHV